MAEFRFEAMPGPRLETRIARLTSKKLQTQTEYPMRWLSLPDRHQPVTNPSTRRGIKCSDSNIVRPHLKIISTRMSRLRLLRYH